MVKVPKPPTLDWKKLEEEAASLKVNKGQAWQEWEIAILKRLHPKYGNKATTHALNQERLRRGLKPRTRHSVSHRAAKLGDGQT